MILRDNGIGRDIPLADVLFEKIINSHVHGKGL
jgi:hypothetical protein